MHQATDCKTVSLYRMVIFNSYQTIESYWDATGDLVMLAEFCNLCIIYYNRYLLSSSVSGLVVKFVVAIDEPGVRFPPDAKIFFFRSYAPLIPISRATYWACTNLSPFMKHMTF